MSVMRTTTLGSATSMLDYMTSASTKYNELSIEASSGKRVDEPSDDPTAAKAILNVETQLSKLSGYLSNISTSQNEINSVDGVYTSLTTSVQKAVELATQTASELYTPVDLAAVKDQIDAIIGSVTSLANTQFDGSYVFSGTATGTAAYSVTKDASGNYTEITYNGNTEERYTQISDGVSVPINKSGSSIFGSYSSTTGPSSGLLSHLVTLSNALGSGDTTQINASIDTLTTDLDTTIAGRSQYASTSSKFDMTKTAINSQVVTLKSYKSELEDADVTQVYADLATQKVVLEATMQVASNILQGPSILDYM